MKIFITGINGFVGSYLSDYLVERYSKSKIYGLVRQCSNFTNIAHIKSKINLIEGDILDYKKTAFLVKSIKPDWIFHLAAKISPRYVKEVSEEMLETNIIGTLHLLKAVRNYAPKAKILIANSATVYGNTLCRSLPIKETCPVKPIDAYGSSKASSEMISQQYFRNFGLKIIIARTFNLLAPARAHTFIEAVLLSQIKLIREGAQPIIYTGYLNTYRDFLDVRDAIKAYIELIKKGQYGEIYNVCANKMVSMQKLLNLLLQKTNIKNKVKIICDPKLVRPIDIRKSLGNNRKIIRQTGWRPEISIEQTLADLLKNENLFSE